MEKSQSAPHPLIPPNIPPKQERPSPLRVQEEEQAAQFHTLKVAATKKIAATPSNAEEAEFEAEGSISFGFDDEEDDLHLGSESD